MPKFVLFGDGSFVVSIPAGRLAAPRVAGVGPRVRAALAVRGAGPAAAELHRVAADAGGAVPVGDAVAARAIAPLSCKIRCGKILSFSTKISKL